jgi:uncharacterized protein YoxC
MENVLNYIIELHTTGDWTALVQLYSFGVAFVILIILLARLSQGRSIAIDARRTGEKHEKNLADLNGRIDNLEATLGSKIEERLLGKVDNRLDSIEQRTQELYERQSDTLENRTSDLNQRLNEIAAKLEQTNAELKSVQHHVEEVENGMPSVFDRLEEFQHALARGYQSELSSVFESFDNAMGALLEQMKGELKGGLSRLEGIEGMIKSRKRAESQLADLEKQADIPHAVTAEPDDSINDSDSDADAEDWLSESKEIEEGDLSPLDNEEDEQDSRN